MNWDRARRSESVLGRTQRVASRELSRTSGGTLRSCTRRRRYAAFAGTTVNALRLCVAGCGRELGVRGRAAFLCVSVCLLTENVAVHTPHQLGPSSHRPFITGSSECVELCSLLDTEHCVGQGNLAMNKATEHATRNPESTPAGSSECVDVRLCSPVQQPLPFCGHLTGNSFYSKGLMDAPAAWDKVHAPKPEHRKSKTEI